MEKKTRRRIPNTRPRNPAWTDEKDIALALRASRGSQVKAAKMLGITQPSVSDRIIKSERLQEVMQEIRDDMGLVRIKFVALCESELAKKVKSGDITAIIYGLKSQGHHSDVFEKWDDKPSEAGVNLGQLTINILVDNR